MPSSSRGIFGAELLSLRQVKQGKSEKRGKKKTEVHLKFYTLLFIYVVFLEGEAWRAEDLCKNPTKNERAVVQSYLILVYTVNLQYVTDR